LIYSRVKTVDWFRNTRILVELCVHLSALRHDVELLLNKLIIAILSLARQNVDWSLNSGRLLSLGQQSTLRRLLVKEEEVLLGLVYQAVLDIEHHS
jgi:hypothetical protein